MTFCILYWFYLFIFTWHNKAWRERKRECVCVFMKEYDTYVVLVQIKLPGLVQSLDWSE